MFAGRVKIVSHSSLQGKCNIETFLSPAKVISRQQKLPLAGKELSTKQLWAIVISYSHVP